MPQQLQTIVCLRCGCAFASSPIYLDFLARRGIKVVTPVLCPKCFAKDGPLPKQRGEVKWFNQHKRYGFITTEKGEEAFFHESQILGNGGARLEEGRGVQFHLHYPIKGPEALNVELAQD